MTNVSQKSESSPKSAFLKKFSDMYKNLSKIHFWEKSKKNGFFPQEKPARVAAGFVTRPLPTKVTKSKFGEPARQKSIFGSLQRGPKKIFFGLTAEIKTRF